MTEPFDDAASRLLWGLRRYALIFVLVVPITTVAALLATSGTSVRGDYQASALVIATKRDFAPDLFARLADSVFTGGSVAEKAVADGKLPIDPRDLIPDHAFLEPVQNNIITRVVGVDPNPELAARIANSAATALVAELNRPGLGVGEFAVQDFARVPTARTTGTSRPIPIVVGLLAGFILGGGIVGLILTMLQPLLGVAEVAELTGAPVVGTPTLPASRPGTLMTPESVRGLSALAKRIVPEYPGMVAIVSCGGDERLRTLVTQLIATVLSEEGAVFLIPSKDEDAQPLYQTFSAPANVVVSETPPDGRTWRRVAVLIDGPSARKQDIPQVVPAHSRIYLVVLQGTPLARVREAAEQFLPGELDGVIFVRRGTWWPWMRSPAAAVRVGVAPGQIEEETHTVSLPDAEPVWTGEDPAESTWSHETTIPTDISLDPTTERHAAEDQPVSRAKFGSD